MCETVLNLMRSVYKWQISMVMTKDRTKCDSVPKPPHSMKGEVSQNPSTAKEDRLKPSLKIDSPHSGNPPVSIPSNTIPSITHLSCPSTSSLTPPFFVCLCFSVSKCWIKCDSCTDPCSAQTLLTKCNDK